jgi:hypothetical protein
VTASQVFDTGEPINMVNGGTMTEPTQNPANPWTVAQFTATATSSLQGGIAVMGPAGGLQTNDRAAAINPATGIAYATNDSVGWWPINQGVLFITENFWATGAGSAAVPAQTDVGESYQITHATFGTPDAGWGIEQTEGVVGTDVCADVYEVLDSLYRPIRLSGQTGAFLVFEINATTAAA